ncbi:MAG: S41 family peptidase [Myxococcota bacterium]
MRSALRCFFLVLGLGCTRAPGSVPVPTSEPVEPLSFHQDIDELAQRLRDLHPRTFKYLTEADFDALLVETKAGLTPETSEREFLWAFRRVVASVACGHTRTDYFGREDALIRPSERFPVDVRWVNGGLYVIDPLESSGLVAAGSQILAINGVDVSELMSAIYDRIEADAFIPHYKRAFFNAYATGMLTYAAGFPETYRVRVTDRAEDITLTPLTSFRYRPLVSPEDPCQSAWCFRFEGDVAVLTVRSFDISGGRVEAYQTFIDDAFSKIRSRPASALVVDVRGNFGGAGLAANYLLRHIADKPYRYWKDAPDGNEFLFREQTPHPGAFAGPAYILVDGGTQSSVGHFIVLAKYNGFAEIVGESSGSTFIVNDSKQRFESTHHRVSYTVATETYEVAVDGYSETEGVSPDTPIRRTVDGWIGGKDTQLAALLERLAR